MGSENDKSSLKFTTRTMFVPSFVLVTFFGLCYLVFGHDWLPVGWDTPRYVWGMKMIVEEGFFAFIQERDYYNFLYQFFGSFFVFLGISPFIVEIFFPVLLCVLIFFVCIFIFRKFIDDDSMIFVSWLFLISWFAVYRLGADLHGNLLGLLLVLSASYFFLKLFTEGGGWNRFLMYFLMFLASFAHIEVTIFFTAIFVFSIVLVCWSSMIGKLRMFLECLGVVLVILPASILFLWHLMHVYSYGVVIRSPIGILWWVCTLGVTFPVSLTGVWFVLRRLLFKKCKESPYFIFVSVWASISVIIGLIHYVFPFFGFFSERAIILFPMPFATALGFKELLKKRGLSWDSWWKKIRVLATISFIVTIAAAPIFSRVFISHDAYRRTVWLSDHYDSSVLPIFVYYDIDIYSGSLGELYDDWVRAIYGEHFAYLGRIDFLISGFETPFSKDVSIAFSRRVLSKMINAGIWGSDKLFDHPIIIIEDFYLPRPLPSYYMELLDELYDGVFVLNITRMKSVREFYVPLWCSIFDTNVHNWSGKKMNGSLTPHVLFYKDTYPLKDGVFIVKVPISKNGNYTLTVRYFDGAGTPIKLFIDGVLIGKIEYTNSSLFLEYTTNSIFLERGIHSLEIFLEYRPGETHFLCLDYVKISIIGTSSIFF